MPEKTRRLKSEINKCELFYRCSTFEASLSWNGFIFRLFETVFEFEFPVILLTAESSSIPEPLEFLVILRTRGAFDGCGALNLDGRNGKNNKARESAMRRGPLSTVSAGFSFSRSRFLCFAFVTH